MGGDSIMAIISETRIGAHGGGLVRIMDDCCRDLTEDEARRRVEAQRREIARVWVRAKMREMEEGERCKAGECGSHS